MTRTNSSNAKKGPKRDYSAYKDFHLSETEGHILSAWMKFSGMDSIEGTFHISFFLLFEQYTGYSAKH